MAKALCVVGRLWAEACSEWNLYFHANEPFQDYSSTNNPVIVRARVLISTASLPTDANEKMAEKCTNKAEGINHKERRQRRQEAETKGWESQAL